MTNISVLKPGFLVSLKTSLRGGVSYSRVDLEREHDTNEGRRRARWETTKEIADPAEFEAATKARGAARAEVARVCCASAFGLLCPESDELQLQTAISEARAIVNAHNASARLSLVDVYVLVGRIAQDDAEAARAIASEVRSLIDAMQAGIRAADPESIREAASKARAIGGMLSAQVAGKVSAAVKEARSAAREIVRRVESSGEAAAAMVSDLKMEALEAARFAFLDLDSGEVAASVVSAPAVELDEEDERRTQPESTAELQAASFTLPFALEL